MTTGSIIWLLAIGTLFYFMMRNGGGCCGGHNNGQNGGHGDHAADKGEENDTLRRSYERNQQHSAQTIKTRRRIP